ncbi:MAG: GPW/gp25 family protein [Planctomycetes bacterium]|nr:GPW/gp25 family protein [Planctomycetota bacterium]
MSERKQASGGGPAAGALKGWSFPVRVNAQGGIALSAGERRLEESVWLVLTTPRGSLPADARFGSRLAGAATPAAAEALAREALAACEPRIRVTAVRATTAPEDERRLLLEVEFSTPATGGLGRVVVPVPTRMATP